METTGEEPDLLYNLGNIFKDQHRADEAVAAFQRALELKPDYHWARVHLAFALLLKGDYPAGWREYEQRWKIPLFGERSCGFSAPAWDGSPIEGETVLLFAEQGFGDTLHFARYAGIVAAMGCRVVFTCQPHLARLMKTLKGADEVIAQGDPLPDFDRYAPLLSLPHLLGTTLDTIPADVPYLAAEPGLAEKWAGRLSGAPGLKVGIAWSGTAEMRGNPARGCPLSQFRPLLDNPDINLFSLQKETPDEDRPLPDGLTDLSAELKDFTDTAAIISNLDLVISIDTAVAHLAGALGRPTWLLLSTAGDWRWLMERLDSPWYPTMRLFRQYRERVWDDVFAEISGEISGFASRKA